MDRAFSMERRVSYSSEEDVREKRKNKYKRIRSKAREQYLQSCGYSMGSKPPLPLHLIAPTQSITNGDKTDNSDESGSVRGGYASSRERSRSREGSRERDRRERSQDHRSEPDYGVIQTQPRPSKGKRPIPRRHTVGGSKGDIAAETERSKEAFMDMLASRYPQYAEKISSTASEDGFPVRGRSRDPRRRATVAYNLQYNRSLDYEGTMSEVDGPTLHRGGYVRSSLPASAARSPPSTLDKPPGLVFLIFRDETKKALLPNEITHLDTVRAMFVRSFPGKLTMSFLESPKRKIYILDPRTNIYYQLEDLRDIKDRTVLRVHECDSQEPQRVLEKPEVRGRTIHLPPGSQGYYGSSPSSAITSQVVPSTQAPPGAPQSGGYVAKGVRASTVVTPQRVSVAPSPGQSKPPAPIPSQTSWRERSPVGRQSLPLSTAPYGTPGPGQQRSQSYRVVPSLERDSLLVTRPRSMTPSPIENELTRERIDKMEHQLASLAAWVQSAVVQSASSTGAPSSVKSASTTASVTSDTSPQLDSASCKIEAERTGITEVKGLSDLASEATATLSQDMKDKILAIKHQADALRSDLRNLRRLQQINKESMIETVDNAWRKIKEAIATVPGAETLLIRQQRNELDVMYEIYLEDKARAEKELRDLEHAVEELRSDVLSRQCRVQMSDVEGMALVLSHVTKALGDLKARFPKLMDRMKQLMSAEMEVIVGEEKFLKDEPERLDNSLKKCKKLTGTLFTLKRLASVQEHRPPQPIAMTAQAKIPTMEDKKAVLENIQAMVPDHEARVHGIQAAEAARERKKKITTQQEALRFGKSLELATKALKSSSHSGAAPVTSSRGKQSMSAQPTSSDCVPKTSTPKSSSSDTSSVISFVMPMSTSTPKSASQQPTSHNGDSSSTSPSISYPVMSLIKSVQGDGQRDKGLKDSDRASSGKPTRNVEFKTEPAILPLSSSESVGLKTGDRVIVTTSAESPSLSEQKNAARAAFFSSLSSPVTPTTSTTPLVSTSLPSTDSPTEIYSKVSPNVSVSPVRGIPSLVRSTAVTMPSSSISTAVTQTNIPKPSSLPMSGTSTSTSPVVSTQRFSPASPTHVGQPSSKTRTTFTAIPKPYSPTKASAPSPLTPESPKYRVPPSQLSSNGSKKTFMGVGAKPKKIPPPPPPRKSSKLPGHAVLAVNAATMNGQLSKQSDKSKIEGSKSKEISKVQTDIIDPPKQFANLETKVERKSSIGSLKQFTTPLLESKRDLQLEKQSKFKQSPLASKKFSSSNLDSDSSLSKRLSKEIDVFEDEKPGDKDTEVTYIESKLSNVCLSAREGSLESSGSSTSVDSQHDLVQEKAGDDSKVTETGTDTDTLVDKDVGAAGADESDKEQTKPTEGGKKPKPAPPQRRSSLSSKPQTEESSPDKEDTNIKQQQQSEVIDRLV